MHENTVIYLCSLYIDLAFWMCYNIIVRLRKRKQPRDRKEVDIMYYIEAKYYEEKYFINKYDDEELCAVTINNEVEGDPREKDILWFETVEDAKTYFNTFWAADDIENDVQDCGEVQGVRYIVRNNEDPSCYEIIAQATYLFKVERF